MNINNNNDGANNCIHKTSTENAIGNHESIAASKTNFKDIHHMEMNSKEMYYCNNPTGSESANCCRQVHMPLLTDMYQITMTYAYWKNHMTNHNAVFDVFFRKNPFGGEFTVFAGLEEVLNYLRAFSYTKDDINYFRSILPETVEEEFYQYLSNIGPNNFTLYSIPEGTVVFPKEPLMRIEGPLPVCQLLETTILTLVNYASLVATNAARYRLAIDGRRIKLYEFGLRRAQGPDGGLSASKYAYIGGFDGTSNLLAGRMYGIPVKGTHAHSFIMSHTSATEDQTPKRYYLKSKIDSKKEVDFLELVLKYKAELDGLTVQINRSSSIKIVSSEMSHSELVAFIAYAVAFPTNFLALVDTYDSVKSGIPNFCAVALALNELGYRSLGVRIDSGDLAYQSIVAYELYRIIGLRYKLTWFDSMAIIVSNDINEETISSLNEQKHRINAFGIGTHLVTCQKQPALGCVYKLVEVDDSACIKISQDVEKVSIPSRKSVFRLYGREGFALCDLMLCSDENIPKVGEKILCRHPFQESKRSYVTPSRVENLLEIWLENGKLSKPLPSLEDIREQVSQSLDSIRNDVKRLLNATPFKVSVTDHLYQFMHKLWLENAPNSSNLKNKIGRLTAVLGTQSCQSFNASSSSTEPIVKVVDDQFVRRITLNNPSKRNALSKLMLEGLIESVRNAPNHSRVLVINATGQKVFSSGHDLKELKASDRAAAQRVFSLAGELMLTIRDSPLPVICQVDGLAAAAGCQLASGCDVLLATRNSSFSTPGANVGLFCSTPGIAISRSAGVKMSALMVISGRAISAQEALQAGLVTRVVEDANGLEKETNQIVEDVVSKSRSVVAFGKEFFYRQLEMNLSDAYCSGAVRMTDNLQMNDCQEGIDAFVGKRKPNWSHEK